ncbi:MAG TPA: preprotein translocase subunit SecG [Verrucomicrobiota bacterium]|nr:preprotein translocase subunit SecG [Verrucomicrobiota bacterium]HRZ38449.1 preprotein translocase subunit SecG [Candidatus Paceibacterota bacterium]HRZ57319.1 preprotein translocase subunit SecG [Candidatus Paceibacterota bacterium]
MALVIGLLTFLLVLNSLLIILLVLVQLPKKEAGAGLAFGGSTSDALFGAGSGTVLSRITKYGVGIFLALSFTLSVLYTHSAKVSRQGVLLELERQVGAAAAIPAAVATNVPAPVFQPLTTNLPLPAVPTPATNAPVAVPAAAPSTDAPAAEPGAAPAPAAPSPAAANEPAAPVVPAP